MSALDVHADSVHIDAAGGEADKLAYLGIGMPTRVADPSHCGCVTRMDTDETGRKLGGCQPEDAGTAAFPRKTEAWVLRRAARGKQRRSDITPSWADTLGPWAWISAVSLGMAE